MAMSTAIRSVFCCWFLLLVWSHRHVCTISNIQIDREDGGQHFIHVNLEKVDVDGCSCGGQTTCRRETGSDPTVTVTASDHLDDTCKQNVNNRGNFVLASSYQHWTTSPPTFTVVFTPGEVILECDTKSDKALPFGVCWRRRDEASSKCANRECHLGDIGTLAEIIVKQHLLPMGTADAGIDHRIAVAIVLLNVGSLDKAIDEFTSVLAVLPTAAVAHFGRGVALARKGLQNVSVAQRALSDFSKAIQLDSGHSRPDMFIHRAEVLLKMHNLHGAHSDVTSALQLTSQPMMYFLRGVISLLMESFDEAERDFRKNLLCPDEEIRLLSHFHLGLTIFYRGKVRNAVEVFKEVLKENPDHVEASLSLAQGFRELGNTRAALNRFNQTLQLQPDHVMVYNLRGNMLYDSGDPGTAVLDFEKCLQVDPDNANCQYMKAASKVMLGQFYDGVKDATKVMVSNSPVMKATPEFIKAHYLREYARYIHSRLDSPISSIQPDVDFSPEYLNHWVKLQMLDLNNYKEQPGLQPEIRDLSQQREAASNVRALVCCAETLGKLSQVSIDGLIPNRRINLAMGLSSIHIAQYLETKWKELRSKPSTNKKVIQNWRELFDIAVYYRRLASIDQPILWVHALPDYNTKDGYRLNFPFVSGSTINSKMTPYLELAFKLAQTMLEHYSGAGAVVYPEMKEDISKATTCDDLLEIAKRRKMNPHGFLVSTQVPSFLQTREDYRLDGGVLVLSNDLSQRAVFALNIANTPDRTLAYSAEMNHLLTLIQEEIRKLGSSRALDIENIISHILSLMYYFYNLSPLSRGSSAVAYSVVLGLLLSLGWQVTGRIPNGRLLDMEAMLAGTPDAFVTVIKGWMSIKKTSIPMADLPQVWELFPNVGSVLEIIAVNNTVC